MALDPLSLLSMGPNNSSWRPPPTIHSLVWSIGAQSISFMRWAESNEPQWCSGLRKPISLWFNAYCIALQFYGEEKTIDD